MTSSNVTLKRPHFFQKILHEFPGNRLWIPRRFMRVHGREISSHVKVKDPKGKKWMLEWSKRGGETYFEKGWQQFADYYSLKHKDVLYFEYMGNSLFSLVIFDQTATEIAYPIEKNGENVQKIKTKTPRVPPLDASAPILPKKRTESSLKYASRPSKIAKVDTPDADFKDFKEDRQEQCFKVGQVWAVYDVLDGMPRQYARISKVLFHGGFKVLVTWLEPNPDNDE